MPIGKPRKYYPGEFKQKVIETLREEKLSYHEAARRFGIPDHKMVAKWERYYLEEGSAGLYIERRGRSNDKRLSKPPKQVEEDLIAEVQRLRMENDYLKNLQALVLEQKQLQLKKRK